MAPVTVHPPDPDAPEGMAWVLGAGCVDHRPGNRSNQPMALVQTWEGTSKLWWDLGLRYHPDLATKWLVGGGQFQVGKVVDEKPAVLHQTMEQAAEEVLEYIASEHPEYAEMLKQIRACGSDEERAQLAKRYEGEIQKLLSLKNYVTSKPKE